MSDSSGEDGQINAEILRELTPSPGSQVAQGRDVEAEYSERQDRDLSIFRKNAELKDREMVKRHAIWDQTYTAAIWIIATAWIITTAAGVIGFACAKTAIENKHQIDLMHLSTTDAVVRSAALPPSPFRPPNFPQADVIAALAQHKNEITFGDRFFSFLPFTILASISLIITVTFLRHGFMKETTTKEHTNKVSDGDNKLFPLIEAVKELIKAFKD